MTFARIIGVLAVGAAALATGCGSSSDGSGETTAPADDASAAITIEAPRDGARLDAKVVKGERLRARIRVRGRARPGSTVFLGAGCRPEPCQARARAAGDGRWAAGLTLRVPRAAPFVTIDANAQRDVVAAGSAVATIELVGPAGSGAQGAASSRERQRSASAPETSSQRTLPHEVLVIGDSLAVGMSDSLRVALPGWTVGLDARIGRPLAEGMSILARAASPPAILAFSLFTNDSPSNTDALEAAVRASATRDGGCAVWATVVRPPLGGVSYDAANALLHRMANDPELALGLQLVDWAAEVARSPSLVARDGVHGTPGGYRVLGRLYAHAIALCAGGG
jgi:hypothetical protein